MYLVTIYDGPNDKEGTVIHSPYGKERKIKFTVSKVLEGIDSVELTINQSNPSFNDIKPLNTLVEIVNMINNKMVFKGRFLKPEHSVSNDGLGLLKVYAESRLAYLHDSRQRWQKVQNTTIRAFLEILIDRHNSQLKEEPHKHFKVGKVTVENTTDNVYRFIGYGTTYEEIKDNLLDRLGGYLQIRDEPDGMYLDYLAEVGEVSDTPIRLRENLKNFQRTLDPTEIITRVIPLGARLDEDEEGGAVSTPRITMEEVNDGLDYMDNQALINEFGIIEGTITYDDINQPSMLKLRAQQFFQAQHAAKVSYDVKALNLHLLDEYKHLSSFEVGNWHDIQVAPLFDIEDRLQIIGITLNSETPQEDTLSIGDKKISLSQYQIQANRQKHLIAQLEGNVDRLGKSNSQVRQAYTEINTQIENVQNTIINADLDSLPIELQEIYAQLEAINTNIGNLPVYGLATPSEDGLMPATDKAKLDRVSVESAVELDALVSSLDNLIQRVEALEREEPGESE